ncbi:MAG: rhodanese-like domain-containing protein [Bacteroidetes bacterium]|nr:rhodanese-like domain-containing protein [Bacteroidota bacterium]
MLGLIKNMFGGSNNEELKNIIKNGALLIDVRTPSEFADGSVKGAINIPVDSIEKQTNKIKNKNNIVVFCRSGARSAMAKSILEKNGFKNVVNGGTKNNVNNCLFEN